MQMTDFPYQRICVVGTTGSGKTTLAGELAQRLHMPQLELDAYHWQPGWQETEREVTRNHIEAATRAERWVADGNYGFLRDILWPRAQALVWLDYPLAMIMWRLWLRTWKRVLTKEVLWGTNRERLLEQFYSKDSIFLWALKTHRRRSREYTTLPGSPEYCHLRVLRFKSPRQTEKWLSGLPE
jgi:adenylate kinase family enzyme